MCEIRVIRKGAGMQPRVGAEQISTEVWAEVEFWRALGVGQVEREKEREVQGAVLQPTGRLGQGVRKGQGRNHSLDGGKIIFCV